LSGVKKESETVNGGRGLPCRCWRFHYHYNLSRQLFQLAHRRPESKTSSTTSDSIRLMMGIALGGIGVVSLRIPLVWSNSIFHVLDLPSILIATFLVAIFGLIGVSVFFSFLFFTYPDFR
jgi:hypothetical protein